MTKTLETRMAFLHRDFALMLQEQKYKDRVSPVHADFLKELETYYDKTLGERLDLINKYNRQLINIRDAKTPRQHLEENDFDISISRLNYWDDS